MSDTTGKLGEPVGRLVAEFESEPAEPGDTSSDFESSGRKPESVNQSRSIAGFPTATPFDATPSDPASGEPRRRRGRPPGSRNATGTGTGSVTQKKTPSDLTGVEKILVSVHKMMAGFFNNPVFEIEEKDAKRVAEAIADVEQYYPHKVSAKTLAWINLGTALGSVYGPMTAALYVGGKSADAPEPPGKQPEIITMPQRKSAQTGAPASMTTPSQLNPFGVADESVY